jgi:hypothetical protein
MATRLVKDQYSSRLSPPSFINGYGTNLIATPHGNFTLSTEFHRGQKIKTLQMSNTKSPIN